MLGDNHVISDISGFKFLASECVYGVGIQEGLLMHRSEFSPYNQQLDVGQNIKDQAIPSNIRTRQTDLYPTNPTQDDL